MSSIVPYRGTEGASVSIDGKRGRMGVPPLAWCPACKRAMQIKDVRPGLRKNSEAINYVCEKCGMSKREDGNTPSAAQ